MSFFKLVRVTVLLTILVIVAGSQWLTRARVSDWSTPLWMTVYPVTADGAESTRAYIDSLQADSFDEIGEFLLRQGRTRGLDKQAPLVIQVAPPGMELPPEVPPGANRLAIAAWSLKMRWWAWRRNREDGLPNADVQMFILYRYTDGIGRLERSVGMQKGMYGIVNAHAKRGMAPRNRIVITHELLHVLGASDKYDLATGLPIAPDGLAEPRRSPLYPQDKAEIMGARIAVSASRARMPATLRSCVIGDRTAAEIGFPGI